MAMWANWLVIFLAAVVVVVVLGLAASFYLRKVRLPREERAAGIASLTTLRWRDFTKIAMEVLERRGYRLVGDAGNDGDYMLARDGGQWLLSTRHGGSSRVDSHALEEFAKDIHMRGADGGLLVSPGTFASGLTRNARRLYIELLDGPTLFPELRPLLPEGQYDAAAQPARIKARQHVLIAWLGALMVGVVVMWMLRPADNARSTTVPLAATAQATVAPASTNTVPLKTAQSAASAAPLFASAPPTDPDELIQRRREVIKLVSAVPYVDRAIWSTQSTLLVYMLDDQVDPVPSLCPILERFDELRTSRLQLQPPSGSSKPVRFLQCRMN